MGLGSLSHFLQLRFWGTTLAIGQTDYKLKVFNSAFECNVNPSMYYSKRSCCITVRRACRDLSSLHCDMVSWAVLCWSNVSAGVEILGIRGSLQGTCGGLLCVPHPKASSTQQSQSDWNLWISRFILNRKGLGALSESNEASTEPLWSRIWHHPSRTSALDQAAFEPCQTAESYTVDRICSMRSQNNI